MPNIKLKSNDGGIFSVDVEVAKCMGIIRYMLNDCNLVVDENTEVPLLKVNSRILAKVLQWVHHHKDDPQPTEDARASKNFTEWDTVFFNVENSVLFALIIAADYLDIPELLSDTCRSVANMMTARKPEEMREMFEVQNDFTPEEETQVREENDYNEE